jgi:thiamine biosynthesis lipoprotein ApbE
VSARRLGASWPALGSTVELRVTDPATLIPAREIVAETLGEFDRACSRFRADSELSAVNARPGTAVAVSELLIDAVEVALRGAELTGGMLDPSIGGALERAGYDRDWELMVREGDAPAGSPAPGEGPPAIIARRRGAWREIEVDRDQGTVRTAAHSKLDLGATAKALAADRCSTEVHERLGCGVLVAIGGDLSVAGVVPVGGWEVHVTDDHRASPESPGQRIRVASGGLASSGTDVRRWLRGGREMHHIIDPRTGCPAQTRWHTVSVAAADCTDANIASTGGLLRDGSAAAWLASLGLPARLKGSNGEIETVAGWPREEHGTVASNVAAEPGVMLTGGRR